MVYFIREIRDPRSPVKIGYTGGGRRGAIRRLNGMQTGNPRRLAIVGLMNGDQSSETDLHYRFGSSRLHGEWFRWTNRVAKFVALHQLGAPIVFSPKEEEHLPSDLAPSPNRLVEARPKPL
jgi:hypothetical protein